MESKNPISKLQELMQFLKRKFPVYTYTEYSPEGIIPIFQCNVTASGHSASARGYKKKDAKRAAAEELLQIIEATLPKIILPAVSISDDIPASINNYKKKTVNMSPISKLQELMQDHGREFPVYTFTECPPQGIVPIFQCNVTASGYSASARDKKKKDAKRAAAEELLRVIEPTLPKIIIPIVSLPDIDPASLTRRTIPDVDSASLKKGTIPDVDSASLTKRTTPDVDCASLTKRTIPDVDSASLTKRTIPDVDCASLTKRTTPDVDCASLTKRTIPDVDSASLTKRTIPDVDSASLTKRTIPDVDSASLTKRTIPDVDSASLTKRTISDVDSASLTKTLSDVDSASLTKRTIPDVDSVSIKSTPLTESVTLKNNNATLSENEAKDLIEGNFIGKLQTICQRNRMNLAKYDVVKCMNILPICFEATCTVGDLSKSGRGGTKQIAKQAAARELIFQLEWSNFATNKFKSSTPIIPKSIPESGPNTEPTKRTSKTTKLPKELNSTSSSIDLSATNAIQSGDELTDSRTSSNESIGVSRGMKTTLLIEQNSNRLNCTINHCKDSGICVNNESAVSESCYLCVNSFHHDCRLSISDLSASDVCEQLLQKKLPISEALHMFHHCDDHFFDSVDNMVDFLDLVISELNCVYSLSFAKTKHKNESVCTLEINDLLGARFVGIAATAQEAFKNAAVSGLRSLSLMIKKHEYHGFCTNFYKIEIS